MMFAALFLTSVLATETAPLVDFDSQVLPLLTHAGCNAGACHGAAAGRGGFHLSLYGSDPNADYAAIVQFAEGRRVNLVNVSKSLVLAKPLGLLDHGGDVVLDEHSSSVSVLRRWIQEGAKRGPQSKLTELRIEPTESTLARTHDGVGLRAIATFSDGKEVDVTEWTVFQSDDPSSVKILPSPMRAQCDRPGKHLVMARFWNRIVPVSILLPYDAAGETTRIGPKSRHRVDLEIDAQLDRLHLPATARCDDATFLRRLQLDLTGRLPTPDEVQKFVTNGTTVGREQKINELLNGDEFTAFWALRLARWLRLGGSPEEPQAARAYSDWIRQSLEDRRPYNEVVRELLTATGDSHVRGAANFTRTASDARQHAELVGSVFMGARIQCANCHNHPFARWTQDDYHGLAAIFAKFDRGRNVVLKPSGSVTNLRTGESAVPRIPGVRDLGETESALDGFVEWMVDKDNPTFANAIVNRLWDAMMGRGLVAGVDDFRETNPPSHPQLLDLLAADFIANGYDLRQTLGVIASSDAYARMPSPPGQMNDATVWYGSSLSKPLLPEVLLDAINDVLNSTAGDQRERAIAWLDPARPSAELDTLGRCSRSIACQSQGLQAGLAANLHLINGDLLNRRIADKNSRLQCYLREGKAVRAILEDFYLRALAKQPNAMQMSNWLTELDALSRDEQGRWLEDFGWAILSSQDFSTNR